MKVTAPTFLSESKFEPVPQEVWRTPTPPLHMYVTGKENCEGKHCRHNIVTFMKDSMKEFVTN